MWQRKIMVFRPRNGTRGGWSCGGDDPSGRGDCAPLKDLSIPASAIGLPTSGAVVQTAVTVADIGQGQHQRRFLQGRPASSSRRTPGSPNLEFEVNLPVNWNRRALQMGGGGYDGIAGDRAHAVYAAAGEHGHPLKQGFVTLGSDGGHKGGRLRRQLRRWTTRRSPTSASSRSRRRTTPRWR